MKHDNIIFPKPNIASHFIVHKSYNYSFWHVINNFLLHVYSLPLVDMPIFSARCLPELWRNQSFFCESRETLIPVFIKIMAIIFWIIPWQMFLLMQYDFSVRFLFLLYFHLSPPITLGGTGTCIHVLSFREMHTILLYVLRKIKCLIGAKCIPFNMWNK